MKISFLLKVGWSIALATGYCMNALASSHAGVQGDQQGFTIHGPPAHDWRQAQALRTLTGHKHAVFSVAFSPNGQLLASGSNDNALKLWQVQDGGAQLLNTLTGHKNSVLSVAFSPNGQLLASGSYDDTIKLWQVQDGGAQLLNTLTGHKNTVNSVAFSPNGQLLASGSWDNTIKLWQVHNRGAQLLKTLTGHKYDVISVAFSPNGQLLASGSNDNTLKLWQVHNRGARLLKTLTGHKSPVLSVAFSPNGQLLASGSYDNTIKLWQVQDGGAQLLKTLTGHKYDVISVAFSPNGQLLASGSLDDTIKLWQVQDGALLKTLTGHKNWVSSVAFSPNGQLLASGGGSFDDDATDGGIIKFFAPLPPSPPPLLSNKNKLLTALEQQFNSHFQQIKAPLKLGLIPAPDLPAPVIEAKGTFESKDEFHQRISRIRSERAQQIAGIQRTYQQKVEARNQRLEDFQANRARHRHQAMGLAFQAVYGQPMLEAMQQANGEADYDAEQHQLHVRLTFSALSPRLFKRKLALTFPDNATGEAVYEALQSQAKLPVSTLWNNQPDDSIAFSSIQVNWRGQTLTGQPSHAAEGFGQAPLVAHIGAQDRLTSSLQNPVLQDIQLEIALAEERQAFDDDIPALLKKAKSTKLDLTKWLFVIGAGDYKETNNILYSRRSAELFAQTAAKVLGIAPKRQYLLLDDKASSGRIEDSLNALLEKVESSDSIYFYFSGHGIPSTEDNNHPYMLPTDRIPRYISKVGFFKLDNIYQKLIASKAAKVIAFMDSCFSGRADDNSVFGQKTASAVTLPPRSVTANFGSKMAVLTAGTAKQYSGALEERGHRMFSYYLIKALLDHPTTFAELATQVRVDVTRATRAAGELKQTPEWLGNNKLAL